MIVSQDNINTRICIFSGILRLYIAACRHYYRIRIHLPGPVEHLPGFPVRDIGHSTGIDDVNIRPFPEGNDLISGLFQHFLHGLCFIGIYLASQIVQCRFFHGFLPLFSLLFLDFYHPIP